MAAEITINQPLGAGAGVADKARQDLWLDKEVELVSSGDGSAFLWELIDKPLDSTATLTDEETALATFTPDKVGTYRIRLTIDESEYVVRVARCRYDSSGVLTQRGWALPAIDEQLGEANYDTNERHWAEVWETIMEDIRLNAFTSSITLGGDLDDWVPTPSSAEQRVVGLNTIPLPAETPEHGDIIQAQAPLMLSQFPFDITSDGTRVWVGDTQSPSSADYGGLPSVLFDDDYISLRYDYPTSGLGDGDDFSIWSVVYLDGYLYATALLTGFGTIPILLQIDPADGTIQNYQLLPYMAYVRTDGTYLYLLVPHNGKNETVFYWVDPADITTLTAIDADPSPYDGGFVDFAYDDVLGKVWLVANNSGHLLRVDGTTHAIDFAVTTVDQPTAIEYGAGYLWVADDSEVYDYYTPGYSGYGSTPEVKVVDPTDGSVVATVTDGYGLIKGVLRSAYDSVNGKLWVVCDQPIFLGDSGVGPRLVRVDVATQAVDGWCPLDSIFNMAITVAGGYVWVVDSPGGDPGGGGLTILKIDPVLVDYQNPDLFIGPAPADAIVARITSGSLAYVFVKQNQELTITATDDYDIQNADAVIVCMYGVDVNLPQNPVIGQRHTIVDGEGTAASSDIDIDYWDPDYLGGNYRSLASINTAYGSKTFVYSSVGWVEV